jgi:hypothetical protein
LLGGSVEYWKLFEKERQEESEKLERKMVSGNKMVIAWPVAAFFFM